jgi:fructose/tagatose bisphosphate aldolase
MKYFIGPMSKNTVDAIIEYSEEYKVDLTFIPSRRQVDQEGGYVNNWTTNEFVNYVKSKSSILIERDHGGPGQGYNDDDGYSSLKCDAENLDIIHIDPWKKYPLYEDGLKWTIDMILYCYKINKNLYYEIGTEEAIRPFSVDELEQFLKDIRSTLDILVLTKIKYVVVQCGTKLIEKENTGEFLSDKLVSMLNVVNKYGFEAKEHNGDWVSLDVIKKKHALGLNNINIAPEFGEIETNVILKAISNNSEEFDELFSICYKSNRWVKWVNSSFDPFKQKELLIRICGHYIFTDSFISKLKEKHTHLDTEIKMAIKNKLNMLHNMKL